MADGFFANMCFLGAIGLFFVVCSPWLVSFFSSEPEVIAYATDCLGERSHAGFFTPMGW